MSVNRAESNKMSELVEARDMMRELGSPGMSQKEVATVAARRLRWTFNRCREILKLEPRVSLKSVEMRQLREATKRTVDNDILARIERLESLMLATDAEFYSEQISHLRSLAGRNRNANEG